MSSQRSTVEGGWKGPGIVKDGLIMYLNANSPNSYNPYFSVSRLKDISGYNNNGNFIGPTFNNSNGGGILFDGINDYVDCGNDPSILSITNQATWGGFVRFNLFGGRPRRVIFKDNGIEGVLEIFFTTFPRCFAAEIVTQFGRFRVNSVTSPALNQIYYLIVTYDGSSMRMYVNGLLDSTSPATGTISMGPGGSFFLGNNPNNPSTVWLDGIIYNVQLYNRALSDQEILQNYNALSSRILI